jgi:Phospholipase_D-nuclease N-terminal
MMSSLVKSRRLGPDVPRDQGGTMPLLDLFWTTLLIFAWVLWFMLLFRVYGDLFTRSDIGGWAKTGWVVLTLLLPFLGVFIYLITEGRAMAERANRAVEQRRAETDAYIRSVASQADDEQRAKAHDLLQSGAITAEEYERLVPSARA